MLGYGVVYKFIVEGLIDILFIVVKLWLKFLVLFGYIKLGMYFIDKDVSFVLFIVMFVLG